MADKKISELTAYTPAVDVDLVPIVDSTNGITKHITWANIKATLKTYFDSLTTTLTNKTLTSPKVGTAIADTSGNEIIKTPATGSAVNEVTVTNSATGNAVEISATGDDTNIDLKLSGKGTGGIKDKNNDYLSSNNSLSRQAIINGNFDVWQRGTTSSTATGGYYDADRWRHSGAGADGGTPPTFAFSRQAVTPGELNNSFYFFRTNVNGAGTSFGNGALYMFENRIENGTRFLCGNGLKVTVSFYAKSDIANKKIGIYLEQNYGSGGSPTTAEIINGTNWTLTSSWTKYTHTFTTNTLAAKTFGTANDDNLRLTLVTAWGSTYQDRVGAVAAQSFVGSGNIDIAQVQLCAGDVALPFMPKSYAQELLDCMRYYQTGYLSYGGSSISGATYRAQASYPVWFRISPTVTLTNGANLGFSTTVGSVSGDSRYFIEARTSDSNQNTAYFQSSFTASAEI